VSEAEDVLRRWMYPNCEFLANRPLRRQSVVRSDAAEGRHPTRERDSYTTFRGQKDVRRSLDAQQP